MYLQILHLAKQARDLFGLRDERGHSAVVSYWLIAPAFPLKAHEILRVGDPSHVIDRVEIHRQTREARLESLDQRLGDRCRGLEGHHVGPWDHHLANDRVAELDDRVDELALLGVDDGLVAGHVGHGEELRLSDQGGV